MLEKIADAFNVKKENYTYYCGYLWAVILKPTTLLLVICGSIFFFLNYFSQGDHEFKILSILGVIWLNIMALLILLKEPLAKQIISSPVVLIGNSFKAIKNINHRVLEKISPRMKTQDYKVDVLAHAFAMEKTNYEFYLSYVFVLFLKVFTYIALMSIPSFVLYSLLSSNAAVLLKIAASMFLSIPMLAISGAFLNGSIIANFLEFAFKPIIFVFKSSYLICIKTFAVFKQLRDQLLVKYCKKIK